MDFDRVDISSTIQNKIKNRSVVARHRIVSGKDVSDRLYNISTYESALKARASILPMSRRAVRYHYIISLRRCSIGGVLLAALGIHWPG